MEPTMHDLSTDPNPPNLINSLNNPLTKNLQMANRLNNNDQTQLHNDQWLSLSIANTLKTLAYSVVLT